MAHMMGLKLGGLLFKTLTKPLANNLKRRAAQPGWFRSLCLGYGQFHHQLETKLQRGLRNQEGGKIKEMDEERAVQLGANVFSELFLLFTTSAVVIYEIQKKSRMDEEAKVEKEKKAKEEKEALEQRFQNIEQALITIQQHVNRSDATLLPLYSHPRIPSLPSSTSTNSTSTPVSTSNNQLVPA